MIRMIQVSSAEHAKSYFAEALSKADYFINDQELKGSIRGKLADRLGLKGEATKDVFGSLCDNKHPISGEKLTPRNKTERRVAYDINFHCPKSVSIVHALSKDGHVLDVFQSSVHETMADIENDSMTRVRKDGAQEDRKTGELIYADFVHQTARPTEGRVADMHLHAHCLVFNLTFDHVEGKLKAGQFGEVKRDMGYYQARFHKRLADKLTDLGYSVRLTDKSFEIDGVPQKVIDLFSKRTDEIGRVAKEKGITDCKELDALGARTRSKKDTGLSMEELRTDWKRQIAELDLDETEGGKAIRFSKGRELHQTTAKECLNKAIKHSFERASVMSERKILERAYRFAIGNREASINDISKEFYHDESILRVWEKNRQVCTTKEVLYEEKEMVELARLGKGQVTPLCDQVPDLNLTGQQADAVAHILTTSNRVSIVRGAAGSGKTTLMKEAVSQIEKAGRKVTVLAPTAQASRGVLREEGFENAETIAQFLNNREAQAAVEDQVIWVDEAGLMGTKDMRDILRVAEQRNARVIFGGDTRQHASVVRGDALRILNTVAGVKSAEVNKIYRQKTVDYRAAVQDLADGNVRGAFERLDAIGSIKTIDPMKPHDQLVEDYMKAIKKKKSVLIVSPTHKQNDEVTASIRRRLRSTKVLGRKELKVSKLSNLNLTEAEKSDLRSFREGQIVQFNQNISDGKRGSSWKVVINEDKKPILKDDKGKTMAIPTEYASRMDVYLPQEIGISKGDKIYITKNGFDTDKKRLNNGIALEVVRVSKTGEFFVKQPDSRNTYKLNKDFGHLAHSYCVTSHASQGKTVDEVFISQPAGTFAATDAKQFYVSVSRGRDNVHLYTDDKEGLLDYASEIGNRESALEMVSKSQLHKHYVETYTREKEFESPISKASPIDPINTPQKDRDYEPGL
jgi:conjugative relaxase-like TrwC/TraI family protein